ncbi:MAG: FtsX-like permease family protein [Limnobacter sp.]|nr:FtsX-like permease family protein [Limnobacter sp.]
MFILQFWVRQSRRASFRILFLALVLAVSAISSVGVFSARLEAALLRDATHMLGGDVVVETRRKPVDTSWQALLKQPPYQSLSSAQSAVFPSVIPSERVDLLVSLKAVNNNYPLRGELLLQDSTGKESAFKGAPAPGEVWVDQGVLGSLGIELGDSVQVGNLSMAVTRVILIEPDRGGGFVNFAPRLMMNMSELEASGLIGVGSRVRWNYYLAGDSATVESFKKEVRPLLSPVDELETIEAGRPEMSNTLSRAKDFLSMSALIGTLVACVGISLVASLFAREQARELAVLKSLGFKPRQLLKIWVLGLSGLALTAGLVGVALGWAAHWGLMVLLADLVSVQLPLAGLAYFPFGIGLAAVLLLGFAAVPIGYALSEPAVAVIRDQKLKSGGMQFALMLVFGVTTTLLVCLAIVQNTTLAFLLFGGFVAVSAVFSLLFWLLLKALVVVDRTAGKGGGRIAIFQSMSRRSSILVLQGVSLSLGLAALMILAVVQGDLIDRWQEVVPDNAPNRFVFNIQPDQVDSISKQVDQVVDAPVQLFPMIRGRLAAINGTELTAESFDNERAQRLIQREFNISFTDDLPKYNTVVQGQWFEQGTTEPQVSIESSVADRLDLAVGDLVTFDFAGSRLDAKVSSVRDLRWDSMEVNFYVIFPPKVLQDYPQTWITAFYAPEPTVSELSRDLVRQFPNITVLDTARVIDQIRDILGKVSRAVQFVFLFTVAAGGLVVVACVLTGARARTRESAIYRALGASTSQLQKAAWWELATIGALAGLVAAVAAQALGWGVAHFVFEFDYFIAPWHVLIGLLVGAMVSVGFGVWSVKKVCAAPVMTTLRQA